MAKICELLKIQHDPRAEVVELLREAAAMVESGADGPASWRVVDALVILKSLNRQTDLPGIDDMTGRGGRLMIHGRTR